MWVPIITPMGKQIDIKLRRAAASTRCALGSLTAVIAYPTQELQSCLPACENRRVREQVE